MSPSHSSDLPRLFPGQRPSRKGHCKKVKWVCFEKLYWNLNGCSDQIKQVRAWLKHQADNLAISCSALIRCLLFSVALCIVCESFVALKDGSCL